MNLIEFRKADLGYGGRRILREVSCVIEPGETVGLVGPNGSGKTTFLRAVLGLMSPSAGDVRVDRSRRFAYVPQADDFNFLWPLTVRETVYMACRSRRAWGRLRPEERQAAESAMERTGVARIADLLLRDASGGQRQKAILAQALSQQPDVLLLDEPTRGLDVVAERDLLEVIRGLKSRSLTMLLVSHSLHIPLNHAEKLLLFKDGAAIASTPEELMRTRRLEEIYGVPFLHVERNGQRWAQPEGRPS